MRTIFFIFLSVIILTWACTDIEPVKQVADNFYKIRINQENTSVKKLLSPKFTEVTSADEFIQYLDSIDNAKGKIESYIVQDFEIKTKGEYTIAKFCYKVRYENGISTDSLILIKIAENPYKILLFNQNFQ